MNEREYKRLRREIEEDYQKKLAALEVVWEMAQQQRPESASKREVLEFARGALPLIETEAFARTDFERIISREHPDANVTRSSLTAALKTMVEDRVIQVVTPGSGKRGTTYRRGTAIKAVNE